MYIYIYIHVIINIYIYIYSCDIYIYIFIEGSLEVKLPTIWTDEKQSRAEAARRGRLEERRSEEKESGRKKMQMREKVGKSRNTVFFPMICGSGGSKSRLAKAAGAEPAGQMRDEKLHAVVVRSTFGSQHVKKQNRFGPLLEVEMSKKCTPLWREAHFQVKSVKNWRSRTTFGGSDVEKVHAVVARSTFPSQNVQKHTRSGPLLEVEMSKKCTPFVAQSTFPSQKC